MKTSTFLPNFDRLEDRLTPATSAPVAVGNVLASVSAGLLTITGDALVNGIDITQTGFKQFTVFSFFGSVNGGPNKIFVADNVTSMAISLGGGDDILSFEALQAPMLIAGNVSISMGSGIDAVNMNPGIGNAISIFGNLSITNGAGACENILSDVNVGGAATFNHAAGGDSRLFIQGFVGVNSFKSLSVANGIGNDTVRISDTNFSGSVAISNGQGGLLGGDTSVSLLAGGSANLLSIGGSLAVSTSSGHATFAVSDYNVSGNVSMTQLGGTASNFVGIEDGPTLTGLTPIFKGNVAITSTGQNPFVELGSAGTPFTIKGGVAINLANSTGNTFVRLDDLASAGNASATGGISIATGSALDSINLDDVGTGSNFRGAVTISTGSGNDSLTIDGVAAGTTFFRSLNANLGAGDDSLRLANNSLVNFLGSAVLNGGATDLNNTVVEAPANFGGTFQPRLIHFHP